MMKHPLRQWTALQASISIVPLLVAFSMPASAKSKGSAQVENRMSPIDRLLAEGPVDGYAPASIGSLYAMGAGLGDLAMDFRATRVGDVVTVVVSEQASATAQGATSSKRTSSAKASVTSLFGPRQTLSALNNLADMNSQQQLDGQGATSRTSTVSTTLSARVIKVLTNGNLIVEGSKAVAINSENQTVSVRGIVRPIDIAPDNSIPSTRVSDLEVRINGKGVVNDAIHRPNILYRLLLGVLPF